MTIKLIYSHLILGLLLVLVIMGFTWRLKDLTVTPPGFYVDESSIGLNALQILRTGKDEHGIDLPIYFKAFGEYKNPIYIYCMVPLYWIFGPSIWATRFASAIWGLITVGLLGYLAWLLSNNQTVVWLTLLVTLVNPWHWLLSRVSFEVISLPVFFLLAIICLFKFNMTQNKTWFYYACLSLGIGFYTYTAARLLAPVWIALASFLWIRKLKLSVLIGLFIFTLCLLPAWFWEQAHPGSLQYAFERVAAAPTNKPLVIIEKTVTQYYLHFTPRFLFGSGDGFLRHMIGGHSGFMWATIPLLFLGLFYIGTRLRSDRWSIFILMTFVLSPIPSSITSQAPHGLRSIGLLMSGLVMMALGLVQIWKLKEIRILGIICLLVGIITEVYLMFGYVYSDYLKRASVWFDVGVLEQFAIARQYSGPYRMPESYYPGHTTTWRFLELNDKWHQREIPLDQIFLINTLPTHFTTGTYIFNQELCNQATSQFPDFKLHVVANNYQGCVMVISNDL